MRWKQLLIPAKSMDVNEAREYVSKHKEGTYTILDVRQPWEYEKEHITGAKLIPLPQLSEKIGEIDPEKPIIVHCAVGGRSRVAAQLLSGQGFKEVYNLKGGIIAWKGGKATGPVESGMHYLKGDESPEDIIVLAYGMEEGLRNFYKSMAEKFKGKETADLLDKLASIEDAHKQKLLEIYKNLNTSFEDQDTFESKILSQAMEGGLTTEEFINQYRPVLETIRGVLTMAVIMETQALDLYMRYAERVKNVKSRDILHDIAEEEKIHLKKLGKLLDKQQ
ncbi:MAG: rhodanese-like domain-containing protein [Candidatus Scalinduaceae bacterium]